MRLFKVQSNYGLIKLLILTFDQIPRRNIQWKQKTHIRYLYFFFTMTSCIHAIERMPSYILANMRKRSRVWWTSPIASVLNYLVKMRKCRVLTCGSVLTSDRRISTLFHVVNLRLGKRRRGEKKGGVVRREGLRIVYGEIVTK